MSYLAPPNHITYFYKFEGQSFSESKDLEDVSAKIISITDNEGLEDNEGKIIHIVGKLEFPEPIIDANYSIEVKAMELSSSVEMYQWIESNTTHDVSLNHILSEAFSPFNQTFPKNHTYGANQTSTDNQTYVYYYNMKQALNQSIIQTNYTYVTYHYAMDWSMKLINSRYFNTSQGHKNPEQIPIEGKLVSASKVQINSIVLGDAARALIRGSSICSDVISDKSPSHPQIKQHLGWYYHVEDRRDIRYPLVGDVREKFQQCGVEGDTFTIIGNLLNGTLQPFDTPQNRKMIKVVKGELAVEEMFQGDLSAVSIQTWLLRYECLSYFNKTSSNLNDLGSLDSSLF